MKFSYNWLKELSGTKKTAEEIAELFLTHSFEVEGIEDLAKGLEKVVVGEVLDVEKHPDADRLNIAQVKVGKENGGELQVVCGAPNLEIGQKVPVALVGAKLPDGDGVFKIKKGKIRGVESNGMICAEDELGIGDDHKGIVVLPEDAPIGKDFVEYIGLNDQILDIDILPNRGHDCLSYKGVARELCVLEKTEFSSENSAKIFQKLKADFAGEKLDIEIKTDKCSRYCGIKIKNIEIKQSPLWMQAKLKASGFNPINNIVDITNYVMLETGQPLHAFSADSIDKIEIRQARKNEKIKLLDEQEIELMTDDIVIANEKEAVALAGVMGGFDSGIKNETKEIILEGANFHSSNIRFTARRHNLQTDAAFRFERDIDPNFVESALGRAVELIQDLAGGKVELMKDIYPKPVQTWSINLSLDYVRKLLGIEISDKEIKSILKRLGVGCEDLDVGRLSKVNQPVSKCIIPTRRRDLRTEEDLIEEVGRIYGYNKIKPKPLKASVKSPHQNKQRFLERKLKEIAVQSGFSEIRGYSFHSEDDAKSLGLDKLKHIELLNPASPEQLMLRNTLVISLLKAGRKSLSYFPAVRLFEIGKVYKVIDKTLPEETVCFSGAVFSKNKTGEQFYESKGLIDNLLQGIAIKDYYYDDNIDDKILDKIPNLHPSRRAIIKTASGKIIGWIGEITKQTSKHFGLKNIRTAVFSLNIEAVLKLSQEKNAFQALPKFPFVERDLSMIVDEKLRIKEVEDAIFKLGGTLLKDVDLFDIYQNSETNKKSLAFHLIFGNQERTLQTEEIDKVISNIIQSLEDEFNLSIRQ